METSEELSSAWLPMAGVGEASLCLQALQPHGQKSAELKQQLEPAWVEAHDPSLHGEVLGEVEREWAGWVKIWVLTFVAL